MQRIQQLDRGRGVVTLGLVDGEVRHGLFRQRSVQCVGVGLQCSGGEGGKKGVLVVGWYEETMDHVRDSVMMKDMMILEVDRWWVDVPLTT